MFQGLYNIISKTHKRNLIMKKMPKVTQEVVKGPQTILTKNVRDPLESFSKNDKKMCTLDFEVSDCSLQINLPNRENSDKW